MTLKKPAGPALVKALFMSPNYECRKEILINDFDIDPDDLEQVKLTLVKAGIIDIISDHTGESSFRLTRETIATYEQHIKERKKK